MALMPEDLDNKRFTPVRFTEGYDMDEVDNFLDLEVLPRLQELIDENARLTRELDEAQNRIAELEGSYASGDQAQGAVVVEDEQAELAADPDQTTVLRPVADVEQTEAPVAAVGDTDQAGARDAAGIIALANRLHDEYVKNGEDERDRLITEANDEHRRIVGEAEEKSRTTLEALEVQKSELEKTIEGLRTFERDYRNRLRNYLENQLRELDTSDTQDKHVSFGL